MLSLSQMLSFIFVGALWGCTNPLLKKGSDAGPPHIPHPNAFKNFFLEIVHLLSNWRFILPFLLNQLGSVAYVVTLGNSAISMAQPICNSLAVLFNCITARLLGEKPLTPCTRVYLPRVALLFLFAFVLNMFN